MIHPPKNPNILDKVPRRVLSLPTITAAELQVPLVFEERVPPPYYDVTLVPDDLYTRLHSKFSSAATPAVQSYNLPTRSRLTAAQRQKKNAKRRAAAKARAITKGSR